MEKAIELGIGFVTGRSHVCKVINNYYKYMINQVKELDKRVNITIFLLYDLSYVGTERSDFYKIVPAVYKDIDIRFITPEDIEEEKQRLISKSVLTEEEADLFLGNGHARGRNTLLYYACMNNMDYLLFWDDDEYPVACIKDEDKIEWKKQENLNAHLKIIEDANVSIGYHCGYISPIPYIDFNREIPEEEFKKFIEVISNDIISWESIKNKIQNNYGITYADEKIANEEGMHEIQKQGAGKWVAGSTLCLNLHNLNKIPAFFNPPNARGEDTFFSTMLDDSKVIKTPVYHFHDGFLQYSQIMFERYPKTFEKAINTDYANGTRFFKACIGWVRYKPLLLYISDREHYNEKIKEVNKKLEECIPAMNKLFNNFDFNVLLDELKEYSDRVELDYNDYLRTNDIWNKLKQ